MGSEMCIRDRSRTIAYGFQKGADLLASDVKIDGFSTNLKVCWEGNVVPLWLDRLFGKGQIYAALSAIAVGTIFNLNLVEISEGLKNYHSLPGMMRLIDGRKGSFVLDDSENASPHSMAEALLVLRRIKAKGKKIAVLGDIVNINSYVADSHESIGEWAKGSADLLFTLGTRAKLLAQGARNVGFDESNIYEFLDREELLGVLISKIGEGDIILVDGSREMNMAGIVARIKK